MLLSAVDLGLAKAVANRTEHDDTLRRQLWLGIAKHVVQVGVCACVTPGVILWFVCMRN
jgi:hypothetical protein